MLIALILFVSTPGCGGPFGTPWSACNTTAVRVGAYKTGDECNRRATEARTWPHVRNAACLPVDE